jgi:hypothetical protein
MSFETYFCKVRLDYYENKVFLSQNADGADQPKIALGLTTVQIMKQQMNRFLISTTPLSCTGR